MHRKRNISPNRRIYAGVTGDEMVATALGDTGPLVSKPRPETPSLGEYRTHQTCGSARRPPVIEQGLGARSFILCSTIKTRSALRIRTPAGFGLESVYALCRDCRVPLAPIWLSESGLDRGAPPSLGGPGESCCQASSRIRTTAGRRSRFCAERKHGIETEAEFRRRELMFQARNLKTI